MLPRIVEARHSRDFTIWLRFSDGVEGEIDLADELDGPIFQPLKDPSVFRLVQLHPELHTLVWPNGADLAPEFLRENLRVAA
jgi:hypothetical protein